MCNRTPFTVGKKRDANPGPLDQQVSAQPTELHVGKTMVGLRIFTHGAHPTHSNQIFDVYIRMYTWEWTSTAEHLCNISVRQIDY